MWLALSFSVLAQVNASTPPSQPTLPSPQDRAMESLRKAGLAGTGDEHYLRRADGRHGDVADPREIDAALDAYDAALRKNKSDA